MKLRSYHRNQQLISKLHLLCLCAILFIGIEPVIAQDVQKQTTQDTTEDNQVYMFVEQMPVFPGSVNAWIYNHVQYPESAKEKGIEGRVYLRFIIEKDGSVNEVKIVRGVSHELDNEAQSVIASMPKWYPGKKNGVPVRVSYTLPVYFALKSTAPSVERRTFDRYLKALNTQEEKLKNGGDTIDQSSYDMYRIYLKKRYGTDKAAYKGIYTSAKEQQQSTEIMLSIVMPNMTLPVNDKNMILKYYKEEWDEQIRLIDSLPGEDFITEYVKISPRFSANNTLREIKIRDYLGLKKFRTYVEECVFNPGKLIRAIIANPLIGKWEQVSSNGTETKQPLQKEFYDDFTFTNSNGVRGSYKITGGQLYSESSESVKQKDVLEYTATYQYEVNGRILLVNGEVKMKLADGTMKNVLVKETWRRIE